MQKVQIFVEILTGVSLLIGLLVFAGKLFSKLDKLMSLPETVKQIEVDLRKNTEATAEVARRQKASEDWHADHLRQEHPHRRR